LYKFKIVNLTWAEILRVFHLESIWNQSIWNEHGIHVESRWIPGGFHVNIYVIYMIKHIPYGIHVEWVESIWNISIPYGFDMECGGMVKYWQRGMLCSCGNAVRGAEVGRRWVLLTLALTWHPKRMTTDSSVMWHIVGL
jgi:hypothetical protein